MKTESEKILRIIPAPGWSTIFLTGDGEGTEVLPLVCFGLVEHTLYADNATVPDVWREIHPFEWDGSEIRRLQEQISELFVGLRGPGQTDEDVAAMVAEHKKIRAQVKHRAEQR